MRWGICAPKQCSEKDVTAGLQDMFTGVYNHNFILNLVRKYSQDSTSQVKAGM